MQLRAIAPRFGNGRPETVSVDAATLAKLAKKAAENNPDPYTFVKVQKKDVFVVSYPPLVNDIVGSKGNINMVVDSSSGEILGATQTAWGGTNGVAPGMALYGLNDRLELDTIA